MYMASSEYITVEVFYAKNNQDHKLVKLELDKNKEYTVLDVIKKSKILYYFPEINLSKNKVSIFGKLVSLDCIVKDNDTVAILRGLIISPMEARLKRAKK